MYLEKIGTGNKIYLGLHGWGADHSVFAPLAPTIPADATFYSADLPGISHSPPPAKWGVGEITAEIVETVSALGNPGVTIVGHCGGAVFGLLAAIRSEGLVTRLVMVDPFAYLPRYFKLFINKHVGDAAYKATFANRFGRWVTNQTLRGKRRGETNLTASFASADHEVALEYLSLFAEMEKIEIPADLSVEIDLVSGTKSFGAVRKSVVSLKTRLPDARVLTLAEASHMPFEEATEQLCRIIFE